MLEENKKKKSLGRGLEALLGEMNEDILDNELSSVRFGNTVKINEIFIGNYQPRQEFDDNAIKSLAESIKEKGVLQPLIVRKKEKGFELIAGERRLRASKMAGLTEVPVVIKDLTDGEVLEIALIENVLRENLSAIEEAIAYQKLIDNFSHTQEYIAGVMGKSRSYVANTLRLLSLPDDIKELVSSGKLSAGHARCLVGLDNAKILADKIIKEDLNVRQVESLVAKQRNKSSPNKEVKDNDRSLFKNTDLMDIEESLKQKLGLRIKISPSKQGGGKVVLQYASAAELDMIVEILNQRKQLEKMSQNTVFKSGGDEKEKFSIKFIE